MRRKKIAFPFLPLMMIVLLMALPSAAFAAMDMFLHLEGIPGESADDSHRDDIDVLNFSWSVEVPTAINTGGAGGTTAARANFSDFCITKFLDKASVPLRQKAVSGGHIAEARFTIRKSGDTPLEFWVVEFTDLIVTKIGFGANSISEHPMENVCFNYGTINWEYTPQKADGSGDAVIGAGWDLESNVER